MVKGLRLTLLSLSLIAGGAVSAMDLEKAIIAAENNDPTLASALANRDVASENIAIARSKLLPQVNAQGNYARANQGVEQKNLLGQTSDKTYKVNSKNSQIGLRQGLIRPRDWVGYSIGELQAEYGAQKLYSAQSDLWLRTVSAWVDVLAAVENRRAQAEAVKSTGHAAEQAKKRKAAGDGTRDNQAEAEAQHELAKAQLVEAEQTLKARQTNLRLLVGEAPDLSKYKLPHFSRVNLLTLSEPKVLERALDINPELLSAKAAEGINDKRLTQAKLDHLPTVDLVASHSKADSDTVNTIGTKYTTSQIGVQISIPLFTGGGLNASERQAAASYAASMADRRAAEVRLTNQVSNDWASYLANAERASSAEALVKAAREQRRSAELGLKAGIRTWAEVANADLLIARREADHIAYTANAIKTQARVLSVLPVTEDVWGQWVRELGSFSKK